MNTIVAALVACVAAAAGGLWAGIQWEQGRQAVALMEAQTKLKEQALAADKIALNHAAALERLNKELGSKRAQLYGLSTGRECLSAGAVRLLNNAGPYVPSAAAEPASSAGTFATDRDVGDALAICRSEHAKLAAQLNSILDIEDLRQ